MSEASKLLTTILESIDTLSELPLRVFDIKIERQPASGTNKLVVSKHGMHLEVVGQFLPRPKLLHMHMTSSCQHSKLDLVTYMIQKNDTHTTLLVPAHFSVTVAGPDDFVWDPSNVIFKTAPSKDVMKKLAKSIADVGERILTRFSRVDLL